MSLPTAEEVTNMYLYGQKSASTVAQLLDDRWIRSGATKTNIARISVDVDEYMGSTGPGRFASAAGFKPLQEFFNPGSNAKSAAIAPGMYNKTV